MRRILCVALALILATIVLQVADSPAVRYAHHPSQKTMLYHQSGPIDLVFLGGSRTWRDIVAKKLASELEKELGYRPLIYNMAFSNIGLGARFVMARDLLERRAVRTLVVEYTRKFGTRGSYPEFFRLGTWSDIADGAFGARTPLEDVQVKTTMASQKLAVTATYLGEVGLGKRPWKGGFGSYGGRRLPEPTKTSDAMKPNAIVPHLLNRPALASGFRTSETTFELDTPEFSASNHYVEALVDLARTHDVQLLFLYLPSIYEPPLAPASERAFETRFGAQLIVPPRSLLQRLSPVGFADTNHLNVWGAGQYEAFLVKALVTEGLGSGLQGLRRSRGTSRSRQRRVR